MNQFRFSEQMDKKPGEALLIRHVLLLHGFGPHGKPLPVAALAILWARELPGEKRVAGMPPEEVSLELDADQLTFNWDDDGAGSGSQEPR